MGVCWKKDKWKDGDPETTAPNGENRKRDFSLEIFHTYRQAVKVKEETEEKRWLPSFPRD